MTVRDVFDLRKQGRVEEAYEAIRPMYAVHKGRYTTLCMFWTASDMMRKHLHEGRGAEAARIFGALVRVAPNVEDRDGSANRAMLHNALWLKEAYPAFSMIDFVREYGVDRLMDAEWKGGMTEPKEGPGGRPHPLPSTAQRMMTHCFHELRQHPEVDRALAAMPLLQEAMRRLPRDKHTRRYMAVAYRISGDRGKAAAIYRDLLQHHHDSYLYAELAELAGSPGSQAALLCQAIVHQRQERFRTGYRLGLARLLAGHDDSRAAYELGRCLAARAAAGLQPSAAMLRLQQQLRPERQVTEAEQAEFYRRMAEKYPVWQCWTEAGAGQGRRV